MYERNFIEHRVATSVTENAIGLGPLRVHESFHEYFIVLLRTPAHITAVFFSRANECLNRLTATPPRV
jgi:hypothetical protein